MEIVKENTAVQAYINMLQGVINRMAGNSANCKTWAITIISAILVLYADDKVSNKDLWICYIPMGLFFFLDCYYLGLERQIIKKQITFVSKLNNGEDVSNDISLLSSSFCNYVKSFFSQLKNTAIAKWATWELGYFHALNKPICVYIPNKEVKKTPYLELHPEVVLKEGMLYVALPDSFIPINEWLESNK